jgi:hypothetical protein
VIRFKAPRQVLDSLMNDSDSGKVYNMSESNFKSTYFNADNDNDDDNSDNDKTNVSPGIQVIYR